MKRALLASKLPDEAWFSRALRGYFPHEIIDRYEDRLPSTRCAARSSSRAWSTTSSTGAGSRSAFRAQEESGRGLAEVARAYTVMREVFGFARYWRDIEALDGKVPTEAQTALYLDSRRLLDRSVRWLLHTRRSAVDVEAEVARLTPTVSALAPMVPSCCAAASANGSAPARPSSRRWALRPSSRCRPPAFSTSSACSRSPRSR
jgi:glutamate dehydrogenase